MPTTRPWALNCAVLAALGLGALPGCDRLVGAIERKAEEVSEEATKSVSDPAIPDDEALTADEKLANKLSLYLECTNRAGPRIRDSWQRYDEHMKEDGTLRKRGTKPFLYKIDSELTPCEEAVTKGVVAEPPLPAIEEVMLRYVEHAEAFGAATVELDTYYEQEGYQDDDWAKGKALAPGIAAAFAAWSEADAQLQALVEARKELVDRNLLARVEARKGKDIEWHSRHLMLEAAAFMHCATGVDAAVQAAKGKAAKAEAKGCEASYTALERAGAEFRGFYDANQAQAEAVFWMSSFERSASEFLATAQALQQALGEGSAAPELYAKLLEQHHGLASNANNLRFAG